MIAIFLIYGLAFFSLGLAAMLEARRASALPLGRQLPWLAGFGLTHGLVEWSDMLLLTGPAESWATVLHVTRSILLPVSALLLIRFGVGIIGEGGPLPRWTWFVPIFLLVPSAVLIAIAVVETTSEPFIASDVWSRYLLYFTGSLLSAYGFIRQWRRLSLAGLSQARKLMLGAALAFALNALVAGLIVPTSAYGLGPWLNYDTIQSLTGMPVQVWRMVSAVAVTYFVVRALDVFEEDRQRRVQKLEAQRERAETVLRESEERFRTVFELAPIGMDIVDANGHPIQSNRALQTMLGYDSDELRAMVFTDYTHPDDVDISRRLVQEVSEGRRDHFHLEKRYYRKDGGLVWGNVAVSCVREPSGQLRYFIAMVEDITERKEIEETLRVEREHAQAAKLQVLTEARQTAEEWVSGLVDISRRIVNMDGVDDVLLDIVQHARHFLGADTVSLALLDEGGTNLELKCLATTAGTHALNWPLTVKNEQLLELLRTGRSTRFPEDVTPPIASWYCPFVAPQIRTALVVPLQFDERVVGGLWGGRVTERRFQEEELAILESLADQAVIALQHAHMAAQMQSLAVLEERSRIAREMHDGLAQILGYLGLQMQTLEALARQGAEEKLLAELSQTRQNIELAQADVRENILSLRTTLSGEVGIVAALEEYVCEFGVQTGNTTELINELEDTPNLSPLVEVQLVRIVQEALSNVRKHARAEHVWVNLSSQEGRLHVSIRDDGVGFRPAEGRHRFGLQTMRERAESVGGRLEITSTLTRGSCVESWLPLLPN